jgi:hypothetical protein
VALVPDRQNTGYHRPGILADLLKIQTIDLADQSDQFHVQVNGIVITAPQFQIGKCIALGELEGQKVSDCIVDFDKEGDMNLGRNYRNLQGIWNKRPLEVLHPGIPESWRFP